MKRSIINLTPLFICFAILAGAGCRFDRSSSGSTNDSVAKTEDRPAKEITPSRSGATYIKGTVVHISDGDTFIIQDERGDRTTIRIHAIDAPELAQDFGKESRENLRALIANQQVEIRRQANDRFKRIVGQVFLNDKDIGLEQIGVGYAWHFKQYAKEQRPEEREAYASAEETARSSQRGLWSGDKPIAPQDYRRTHESRR